MKIGISTLAFVKRSFDESVEAIKAHDNIKCWEIIDDSRFRLDKERARILSDVSSSMDVEYSVHAPLSDINVATLDPKLRTTYLEIFKFSLEMAQLIDAKTWVFHPGWLTPYTIFFPDEAWRANLELIRELANLAEELEVGLAVENLFAKYALITKLDDMRRLFDELKNEKVGFCLDVGHANIVGVDSVLDYITEFHNQLVHVHAHDNDGKGDSHSVIGEGSVHWPQIMGRLREINYDGMIIIESFSFKEALLSHYNMQNMLG
ncbi:MAG: TIM barrel protein [Nitrososphaeria archaeon]|nr:TIM barrel protein [Nitrososphaeria archaeon]NIQ33642.1 TIM barrel protein [Nitrososphaeria archaeon]